MSAADEAALQSRICPTTTTCWLRCTGGARAWGDHDPIHSGGRRPGSLVDVVEVVQQAHHLTAAHPLTAVHERLEMPSERGDGEALPLS